MAVFTGVYQKGNAANPMINRRAAAIEMQNRTRRAPLSKFERQALEQPTDPAFIYNISPIWTWDVPMQGVGNFRIEKAEWYTLKDPIKMNPPLILAKRYVRHFDKGDGKFDHMIEEPLEIAEDVLRCSTEYPQRDTNNRLNYGCLLLHSTPLDKRSKDEQQEILSEAAIKHEKMCRMKVFEADAWSGDPVMRRNITEMMRKCALFLGEVEQRTWVTLRGPQKDRSQLKECQFCGFDMKNTAVKCPNCREIVDQEGYDAMKKGKK